MRYMVEHNYVQVIGATWAGYDAAYEYRLSDRDVKEINDYADIRATFRGPDDLVEDEITRKDVAQWVAVHTGDFQSVTDFNASIGDLDIDWEDLENAFVYHDCMYGNEED